jgi:RNA polymerase sigma-70 factor, ECF subfamily
MASVVRQFPTPIASTEDSGRIFISPVREVPDTHFATFTDSELIEHLKSGSRQALGTLFLRYRRLVLAIGLRILRDNSEAEDVAQDVFLEIYEKAGVFDPQRGSVKMWILQYAYSRSLDRRRYLALRRPNGPAANDNGCGTKPAYAYNPHVPDGLTLEERAAAIRKALATLPSKQRKVLELAYFQGLLMTEIAESTNETLGNVRNQYYRGLKKLQYALDEFSA